MKNYILKLYSLLTKYNIFYRLCYVFHILLSLSLANLIIRLLLLSISQLIILQMYVMTYCTISTRSSYASYKRKWRINETTCKYTSNNDARHETERYGVNENDFATNIVI